MFNIDSKLKSKEGDNKAKREKTEIFYGTEDSNNVILNWFMQTKIEYNK